jgi:hypothetical protein
MKNEEVVNTRYRYALDLSREIKKPIPYITWKKESKNRELEYNDKKTM